MTTNTNTPNIIVTPNSVAVRFSFLAPEFSKGGKIRSWMPVHVELPGLIRWDHCRDLGGTQPLVDMSMDMALDKLARMRPELAAPEARELVQFKGYAWALHPYNRRPGPEDYC